MALWQVTSDGLRLRILVQPRGSRNRVIGVHGDSLKIQVTAPPVEGAANTAVVDLLSDWLKIPRGAVKIVAGHSSRHKVVMIFIPNPTELTARLQGLLAKL